MWEMRVCLFVFTSRRTLLVPNEGCRRHDDDNVIYCSAQEVCSCAMRCDAWGMRGSILVIPNHSQQMGIQLIFVWEKVAHHTRFLHRICMTRTRHVCISFFLIFAMQIFCGIIFILILFWAICGKWKAKCELLTRMKTQNSHFLILHSFAMLTWLHFIRR